MPGNHSIASVGFLDSAATLGTIRINGVDMGPHSRVGKVRWQFGEHPGTAQAIIPLAALDDIAPSIAGVASSPLQSIKHHMTATISAQQNPGGGGPSVDIFTGVVTDIDADIGDDCGLVTISDARFDLEGIQIIGSFWLNPIDNSITYRAGVKAHFNKNNSPNMAWSSSGGMASPVFCEEYYGVDNSITTSTGVSVPSASVGTANATAEYWTPATMLQYLHFATSTQGASLAAKFPFYKALPDYIVWSDDLGSAFAQQAVAQERKAAERVYHCHSLIAVISDICKMAGPYAPTIQFSSDGTSTLGIVRTRYNGQDLPNTASPSQSKGFSLERPTSGMAATTLTQGGCVTRGKIRESSRATYSVVAAVGGRAMIEARFVSDRTVQNPGAGGASMWWGWTTEYSNQARASLLADGQGNISGSETAAIANMLKKFPDLFAVWFINPQTNFQAGTSQDGYPIAAVGRPPLPHLLTSFIKNGSADRFARINSRRPIPVELSTDGGTTWTVAPENDGLIIEPNGHISLKALRDSNGGALLGLAGQATYKIVSTGGYGTGSYAITTFEPAMVRMNLAVPCDHRVTGAIKMSWDPTPDPGDSLPIANGEIDDGDRMDPSFSRLMAIDTGALYSLEERGGTMQSFPLPESLKDPTTNAAYPSTDSTAGKALYGDAQVIVNDTEQAANHALRRIEQAGRLDRGGNLISPHIILTEPAGAVNDLGGFKIGAQYEALELDFEKQTTERILV